MFEFSNIPQKIRLFNYSEDTKEFINESNLIIPAHTGLPANSTDSPLPDAEKGFSFVFINKEWTKIENNLGKTIYDTTNRQESIINTLGTIPKYFTLLKPNSEFDEWNGECWIKNKEIENIDRVKKAIKSKSELMKIAKENINILMDASEGKEISKEEKAKLSEWKAYRLSLYRLNIKNAGEVIWPEQPTTE